MKKLSVGAFVCALVLAVSGQAGAGNSEAAFEKLKTLVGDWEAKLPDGNTVRVNYRVTSAGSVLLETMMPGQPSEMLTLYNPDGDSVIATHYCEAKNQPRMRASGAWADGKQIAFKFLDVTNLASPEAEHMREVVFSFQDNDHFTARWTSRANGKDTSTNFVLTRVK